MSGRLTAPARSPLRRSNLNLGKVSSPIHAAPSKSVQSQGWALAAKGSDVESDSLRRQAEALDRGVTDASDASYETGHLSETFQKFWQVRTKKNYWKGTTFYEK